MADKIKSLLDAKLSKLAPKWTLKCQNSRDNTVWYEYNSWQSGRYFLRTDTTGSTIGYFQLIEQIHCCGILVLTEVGVMPVYKDRGIAHVLVQVAAELAHKMGYSQLLCTYISKDCAANARSKSLDRLFACNGFNKIHSFTNSRTKNIVSISVMEIEQP